MVKTQKFVRKPLYVDAVQVTAETFMEIALWCQGEIRYNDGEEVPEQETIDPAKQHIHVRVHNPKSARQTKAFVGDWILYTERGYKVYTQKAFKASFDPVDGENEYNKTRVETPEQVRAETQPDVAEPSSPTPDQPVPEPSSPTPDQPVPEPHIPQPEHEPAQA